MDLITPLADTFDLITPLSTEIAVADRFEATESGRGSRIVENVLENDTTPEGGLTVVDVAGETANVGEFVDLENGGRVKINGAGRLVFRADGDFEHLGAGESAVTTVTYTVADAAGVLSTATVEIVVTGKNDKPVFTNLPEDRAFSVAEGETFVFDFDAEDRDANAELTYSLVRADRGDARAFEIDAETGALSFKDAPDFEAPTDRGGDNIYEIRVRVTDDTGARQTRKVTVEVTDTPDPAAQDDVNTLAEDGLLVIDLLANDSDPDGDDLSIVGIEGGTLNLGFGVTSEGGRVGQVFVTESGPVNFAFDTNGQFEDLAAGETDTVTLSYTVSDGTGFTDTADIIIFIEGADPLLG